MRHIDPLRAAISHPVAIPATALTLKGLTYQVGDTFRNSRHFDLQLQGNDHPIVPWVALSNLSTQYENLYWAALVAPLRNSRPSKHEGCTYTPVWDGGRVVGVSARISSTLSVTAGVGTRRNSKLIQYGLISTRGKGSSYEVTFLAKHPDLAEAVITGFKYTAACANEEWPEEMGELYISAAREVDERECRRLLAEANEEFRQTAHAFSITQ
mgnify:FL=1|jgi:hypothetical protein|nr:MAG TPA: hypothetical protein [Caudoviricetes sp.]